MGIGLTDMDATGGGAVVDEGAVDDCFVTGIDTICCGVWVIGWIFAFFDYTLRRAGVFFCIKGEEVVVECSLFLG